MAAFSGYLAIDEVYDGPFCILSIVDNRTFRRLAFRVLEQDPDQTDMRSFLTEFKGQLEAWGLVVRGITTDGLHLYPTVLKELWSDVPHQICVFHVLKEITKAVLRALAQFRKELAQQIPKQPRGRPRRDRQAQAKVRQAKRLKEKVAELFKYRFLFVCRQLTPAEQKIMARLVRGRPRLRALREIMTEVYRLFDRRCSTATALKRLARLRAGAAFQTSGQGLGQAEEPHPGPGIVVFGR